MFAMLEGYFLRRMHKLPPEQAHQKTLNLLSRGIGVPWRRPRRGPVTALIFGKTISPVMLAAGVDKNAVALRAWEMTGFGGVEVGSVRSRAFTGNDRAQAGGQRMWRYGDLLWNWLGMPQIGRTPTAGNISTYRRRHPDSQMLVGANVAMAGNETLDDLKASVSELSLVADYITVNVSCPNVGAHGDAVENLLATAVAQVRAAKEAARGKPVMVKLGPMTDMDLLRRFVRALHEAGADGFVACNTIPPHQAEDLLRNHPQRDELLAAWPRNSKGERVGGLSGPILFPFMRAMVRTIRAELPGVVIFGAGGISSARDARQALRDGANAVQINTGLGNQGSGLVREIVQMAA